MDSCAKSHPGRLGERDQQASSVIGSHCPCPPGWVGGCCRLPPAWGSCLSTPTRLKGGCLSTSIRLRWGTLVCTYQGEGAQLYSSSLAVLVSEPASAWPDLCPSKLCLWAHWSSISLQMLLKTCKPSAEATRHSCNVRSRGRYGGLRSAAPYPHTPQNTQGSGHLRGPRSQG